MEEKKKARYGLVLLIGLLVLRLVWFGVGRYIFYIFWPNFPTPLWLENIYVVGTYLLTGLFIYLERDRLGEYHITSGALWIILLSPIVVPLTHWVFGTPLFDKPFRWQWDWVLIWPQVILAVVFLYVYLRNRKSFRLSGDKFHWIAVAVFVGVVTGIFYAYLVKIAGYNEALPMHYPFSITAAVTMFVSQVGIAGVSEEPFFRGILWGYLKRRRMPEIWIWLLQAFLFGLSHIYHLHRYLLCFWVAVPVAGLVLGYVAWRSRSIAMSMVVHGFINTIGWLIPYFIQLP